MQDSRSPDIERAIELQRLRVLYARLPGSILSMLLGVFLAFVFLFESGHPDLLKGWIAYMLTTLALRSWVWHQFNSSLIDTQQLRIWEWLYAGGMALTALGWMMICGPLYPDARNLQDFVWVMIIFVAFSGMVLAAPSMLCFVCFIIPTLLPGLYRFVESGHFSVASITGAGACLAVILITHRGLRRFTLDSLHRQVVAEQLLAEQQAIFQGATAGIAVVENRLLIKCNKRFGELFGRGLNALQSLNALELFVSSDEGERFISWSAGEFEAGRSIHSMERMRRADGTQFWAEISGRQLEFGSSMRNIWLVTEAAVQQRPAQ